MIKHAKKYKNVTYNQEKNPEIDAEQEMTNINQTLTRQKAVSYCKVAFLQGMSGAHQANYLTSADKVIPD